VSEPTAFDALTSIIRVLDALEERDRPVWAEKCACGATVAVGREAANAERRRVQGYWWNRHRECTVQPLAPVLGVASFAPEDQP
jgi:hypothetical protein